MRLWINRTIEKIELSDEVNMRRGREVRKLTIFYKGDNRITMFLTEDELRGLRAVEKLP